MTNKFNCFASCSVWEEEVLILPNMQLHKEFLNSHLHQESSLPGVSAVFAGQWNLSRKMFVVRNVPA